MYIKSRLEEHYRGQLWVRVSNLYTYFEGEEDQPVVPVVAAAPVLKCRVMLQKEVANEAPKDEECGDAVQSGHAGLCE